MTKTLRTRFRRRPKNLMDFFRVHGAPTEIVKKRAQLIEELKRERPQLSSEAQRRISILEGHNEHGALPNPRKMMAKVRELVGNNPLGKGCTFIFPLTSMAGAGEFIKGFCSEAAPKAKIVLVKRTAKGGGMFDEGLKAVVEQLRKSLQDANRAIIIDDMPANGYTLRRVKEAIDETGFSGTILPEIVFTSSPWRTRQVLDAKWHAYPDVFVKDEHDLVKFGTDFMTTYLRVYEGEQPTWVKNRNKTLYMDPANALKYVQKHGKDISGKPKERLPENEFTQQYNKLRREVIFRRRQIYNLGVAYAKQALLNEKVKTK